MEHPIGALPCTPFASSRRSPQGETRSMERKNRESYISCTIPQFPPLVVNAVSQSPACVSCHMTQKINSRNVLASPLGEEGHEVAKGVQANWIHRGEKRPANPVRRHPAKSVWTVVILIMILDVDVTAAGVSKGEAALFLHDCLLLANTVISSGDACRYGADGKRFNDTLSREISHRNAARTIRGGDFSTPLRFARNDGGRGPAFFIICARRAPPQPSA